jgi:hypothetical protein
MKTLTQFHGVVLVTIYTCLDGMFTVFLILSVMHFVPMLCVCMFLISC